MENILKEYEYLNYKDQKAITYLLCWQDDIENGRPVPERHYTKIAELQEIYSNKIENLTRVLRHEYNVPECVLSSLWHKAMHKAAQHKYHC